MLQTSHHCQATRRLETGIEAHWASGVFIEGRGNCRPPQWQHAVIIHDDHVGGSVIHHDTLKSARCGGSSHRHTKIHIGAPFPVARQCQFKWSLACYLAVDRSPAWGRKPAVHEAESVFIVYAA
jgi:hypothetical protein